MAVENGEWIMHGLDRNEPDCLHSPDEVIQLVNQIGFLPLFSNSIEGFSLEEQTCPEDWWCGDPDLDPWEWRAIIARGHQVAYGKFFEGKAGFISVDYLPYFVNARRDGYDFDARWDDEKASIREKKIMDLFMGGGTELFSYEIKDRAGFGKGKEKGFEGTLTRLQMETYLCVTDFRQKKNKRGESYGWSIAVLTRPEDIWGDVATSAYSEDPKKSALRIGKRLQEQYPDVTAKQLKKIVGTDVAGTERKKAVTPYPQNLLRDVFDPKKYTGDAKVDVENLTKEQLVGLELVIGHFEEIDQDILRLKYQENLTNKEIGLRINRAASSVGQRLKQSLRRLRHPLHTEWIEYGFEVTRQRRKANIDELLAEARRKMEEHPEKEHFYKSVLLERGIDINEPVSIDVCADDTIRNIQYAISLVDEGELTPEGHLRYNCEDGVMPGWFWFL